MSAPALRSGRATCYGAPMSTSSHASASHENRLAQETSPYLLQHQHNPVDWWAWGPEALAEAKRTGRPILLSVGYAACHWCHVMAHESFEDDATARVMNELFVNIKVDREERPDIDQIYMAALHHLGRAWRLAADHVSHARRRADLGRHVFSQNVALRQAGLRRRAARDRAAVPRGAAEDREQSRGADGAARRDRAKARHRDDRCGRARQRGAAAWRHHRSGQRRHPRRAEISASRAVRAAVAGRAAQRRGTLLRRRRHHPRPYLRGRHLRSSRRRFFALFGR